MTIQTLSFTRKDRMVRFAAFLYGLVCYAISFVTLLYTVGFVGNFTVPRSIDSAPVTSWHSALIVDAALIVVFGLQHSVMARKGFKNWWTQFVPKPIERSTYILCTSLCLIALFYLWQPIGGSIWNVANPAGVAILYTLFAFGWLLVLATTFWINHFDLFGLRQVWLYLRGKEYTQLNFATPSLYKYVRHPLYVGLLLAFWSTPTMTATHLGFALMTTAYILIGIQLEERDLADLYGKAYADYRRRVPMLFPFTRRQHEQHNSVEGTR
jgi:methanethiol S-methyltransferase